MKKKLVVLSAILLMSLNQAYALDFVKFFDNMFSKKAGYKALPEDGEGEKDLNNFQKNSCDRQNPWGTVTPYNKDKDDEKGSLFICRDTYDIRYDTRLKTPLWATYILRRTNYNHQDWTFLDKVKYAGNKLDPDLPKKMQPELTDYAGSDYVPHNLVPIVDTYYYLGSLKDEELTKVNQDRVNQAYSVINTLPIYKSLNAPLLSFEAQTNKVLKGNDYENILVVTGAIYMNGGKGRLGKSGPIIPSHIFKIFANGVNKGTTSYVIPNDNSCANGCDFNSFIVPFKEVERLTGYNIFSAAAPEHAAKIKLDANEYNKLK